MPPAGPTPPAVPAGPLPRNDPRQYDELAGEWWRPDGAFAMLHWLARARAALVPPASRPDALLVDLGCGAGLLAPHLAGKGYRHVGVDLTGSALEQARTHGVTVVNADATAVPLADGCADVVAAGELLEHVPDWRRAVGEACRLLRPGGLLVLDTLNDTALSRLVAVGVAERLPTVPRGIHDPRLFVDHRALLAECARHGVDLRVRGVRPEVSGLIGWLARRLVATEGPGGRPPRIVPTWSTAVLYQGRGVRRG
ncbi:MULTISPECIES: methyltransferase domain-containing protein [Micromonospora]|uniref:2-polyprenyl-6-hydroxyphenyl methylase / 3-demethylubiquinone-9 3-methyltransferase n=1 Tax=Micromonospora yangpuensis TaxID=683228 RepID=A0A1C6VF66_9ACTN|nr:methyltransferase domain-containing protein [Micromonospora yangpuensis]GGM30296.1 ubiquinone biosynthesis O-methyltransferase [Micromonospora yangpuensis]SCL64797.1 2-polyprenyl-6-hydroxyphenyl methylase / 3-demethylubiquinone-9 3-methyltransferase [Micromonospora yangpuensis]